MTDAVWINYAVLKRTTSRLEKIIEELDDAGDLADELRDAIGSPFGENALRDKVGNFEGRWNDKRNDLVRDMSKIYEHVAGIVEGFADWDAETASQMDVDASGTTDATRPTPV